MIIPCFVNPRLQTSIGMWSRSAQPVGSVILDARSEAEGAGWRKGGGAARQRKGDGATR